MKIKIALFILLATMMNPVWSQVPDSCKLEIGTNLGGLADYGTEIAFVDLMKLSRTWYTKSIGDPNDPFNSEFANQLEMRPDGYPTHIPQSIDASPYPQKVATIWAITSGWPAGEYTILWDGEGTFTYNGTHQNLEQTDPHRVIFDMPNPIDGVFEIQINSSDISDPIRNIRLLMPGTEFTYEMEPFYPLWVEKVSVFETVRFMDWASTNGWGIDDGDDWLTDPTLTDWSGRSQVDHYTWAYSKGVPYEMMVKFMNDYDKDGWVCVPHTASEEYIRKMAQYFRDNLEPDRHIYVEYSNEIWNFIFPQTQWVNFHGCELTGTPWPEGTAPYVQRMLDYWTEEFVGQLHRTTRVVGVFTGWLDVAQRLAFNLDTTSFDVISPTYYFSVSESLELELDTLGSSASVADLAGFVRQSMQESFDYIAEVKTQLADVINKPLAFYEGGQHLTPHPFGIVPTYEDALVDIQRDTAMYNLYNEWFDKLRTLQVEDEPMLLMNFSFIASVGAQYGSWGVLETMDQDVTLIPAPKYQAVIENMNANCIVLANEEVGIESEIILFPNPTEGVFTLKGDAKYDEVTIFDTRGVLMRKLKVDREAVIDISNFQSGLYFISIQSTGTGELTLHKLIKL